jgi:pyruvate kinase
MPASVRRTKIVATLGPAWAEPAQMTALLDAGVNVVRINASHATSEIRAQWVKELQTILQARTESGAILVDLQGPRIRVGTLAQPLSLEAGQQVVFAPEAQADAGEIPTTYDDLAADVRIGARILLDDGLLALEVTAVRNERVEAVVHYGGELRSHKGMNLPGLEVSAPALTEKDLEDVRQATALGVDYIALSFVRRPEDMEELRRLVPRSTKLIAKIEKARGLRGLRRRWLDRGRRGGRTPARARPRGGARARRRGRRVVAGAPGARARPPVTTVDEP